MDTNADRLWKPASDTAVTRVSVEECYRTLVDAIQDYATFFLDPTGYIASWNAGAQRIKGYHADEIIGQHFSVFHLAEAIAQNYPGEELRRAAAFGRWEDEGWRIRKDGSCFWANVVVAVLRDGDGDLIGLAKVTRDLTERERLKQLEYVSKLASRVEVTHEEEKKRTARGLYDDLGQQLTVLKMIITGLPADNSTTPEALAYAREGTLAMSHAIDHVPALIRRPATGLRLTILDGLGLLPVLDWLVTDFGQHTGLRITLVHNTHAVTFNDVVSTALSRIVQEGLTNVARHAMLATKVVIDLWCDRASCELMVHNNDTIAMHFVKPAAGRSPSSGIVGIHERVYRLGGTFAAGPLAQGGYRIQLSIPRKVIALDAPSGQ